MAMLHNAWKRTAALAGATCALALFVPAAAAQEPATPAEPASSAETLAEPPRFSDGFELRTGPADAPGDAAGNGAAPPRGEAGRFGEPLGRQRATTTRTLGGELRETPLRAPGEAPAGRPADLVETPAVDLFAGPDRSRRENLPDEPAAAAAERPAPRGGRANAVGGRIDPLGDPLADPADRTERTQLFRAIGPVRSPALDDVGLRRLNTGFETLGRVLAVSPDDPYGPVGTRVGSFRVFTALEQSLGASDNLTNSLDGVRGAFSQTTLTGRAVSDWSRHAAEINASAVYRRNFSGPVEEEPRIDLDGRLRLDLADEWTATLRGALAFSRDDGFLTGDSQTAANQEDVLAYSASAELSRSVGLINAALTLQAVREDRTDGVFSPGLAADGGFAPGRFTPGDSFTTYTAGLRGGYDLTSTLSPFVAFSVGRRLFDEMSGLGVSRDSVIPALKAGLALDFGEKLRGEVAAGYAWNLPDDDAFSQAGSPTLDAALTWSPRRGTDVVLGASTFFEPDSSGLDTATLYQGTVSLRHRATARLDWESQVVAGVRRREIGERERLYAAETGFTYHLNRQLALLARYRYDRFDAAGSARDYDANTVRLGVRLQN